MFNKIKKLTLKLFQAPQGDTYNPDCYWTIDEDGRGYLHYKDMESIEKHFASQIEGARILSKLIKERGDVKVDDAGRIHD